MTKRDKIEIKIESNKNKITELKKANIELRKKSLLLSDKEQWFTEKTETVSERNCGKKVMVDRLIGRIHWKETYYDEDTGNPIIIDRQQVVRVDGIWQ